MRPQWKETTALLTGALLVICALACSERRPATGPPESQLPATGGSELKSGTELAVILPKIKRTSKVRWAQTTTLPGHLGAPLITRQGSQRVLLVTVDDLGQWPERVELLAAAPKQRGELPIDVAAGSWVRALVANRYEVVVRAEADSWRDEEKIDAWFDRLEIKKLQKLAEEKKEATP